MIMLTGAIFNVPGIVSHPQFADSASTDLVKTIIWGSGDIAGNVFLGIAYYAFFIVDVVWAAFLLIVMWNTARRYFERQDADLRKGPLLDSNGNELSMKVTQQIQEGQVQRGKLWLKWLAIVFILAYCSDLVENGFYFLGHYYLAYLVYTKISLYAVSFLSFIFALLYYIANTLLPLLWSFIRSAYLSLFFIAILGVFLPTADQVNSIVVELYTKPWNMIILLLSAPFFAVVFAHYPSYFGSNIANRYWYMAKHKFLGLLGTVHYQYKSDTEEETDDNGKDENDKAAGKNRPQLNYLFRLLGISFYAALFYMVAYPSQINFSWLLDIKTLALVLFISGAVLLFVLKRKKDQWYRTTFPYIKEKLGNFYDGDHHKAEGEETSKSLSSEKIKEYAVELRQPILIYLRLFFVTAIVHLVFFGFLMGCLECNYTWPMVGLSLACIILQMFTFVFYRSYRSLLRFSLFNEKIGAILFSFFSLPTDIKWFQMSLEAREEEVENSREKVIKFIEEHGFVGTDWVSQLFKKLGFGALSNNISFLQFNARIGILNVIFLIWLNIDSAWATRFSTIIIILSYLFFFYGIVVVLVKNRIFYTQISKNLELVEKPLRKYDYFLAGIAVFLLVGIALRQTIGNELFTLTTVPRDSNKEITLEQYADTLGNQGNLKKPRYYIGTYGGGLKSNGWTMSVLEALHQKNDEFLNQMVGISGASGGTMGMVNWFAIQKGFHSTSQEKRLDKIKAIATENILSLDVVHLLGRDSFIYTLLPGNYRGYDRSSLAMERLSGLSGDWHSYKYRAPYREYWEQLASRYNYRFPIFIANTTDVRGNGGMAVSVGVLDSKAKSLLYQNTENILEIDRTLICDNPTNELGTLSYYDASATSNRFPLLSPAAKIETHGHFNDGGLYENSGMLSIYKLFRAVNHLNKQSCKNLNQRNVFINIINSKDGYVEKLTDEMLCEPLELNAFGEASIIFSSLASTEMMPIFFKTELQRLAKENSNIDYYSIYLPHIVTVQDIKDEIGKKVSCKDVGLSDGDILKRVRKHNDEIRKLVDPECDFGDVPIVEPATSRATAAPAYEFMYAMLQHPRVKDTIDEIFNY